MKDYHFSIRYELDGGIAGTVIRSNQLYQALERAKNIAVMRRLPTIYLVENGKTKYLWDWTS